MALLAALEWKYVTEDHIREWKSGSSPPTLHLEVPPARFIYELCWAVVRGDLPLSKCRVALDSVEFAEAFFKEETSSLLADTVAHMGQELTLPGEFRTRLIELAKWLVENGLTTLRLLQERCEAEFLWEAEIIKIKALDLKSKEVRVNTRLLYQQTKFNLLREESEGYAKLITLLSQRGPDGLTERTAPVVISTLKSLIGHFDLDPNRVFDIVLECYELQTENKAFLELIPLFPKSHTSHILGFKFQHYQRAEVEENVPTGLYILAATLIKAEFIDQDSVYAHLQPRDEDAFTEYEELAKRRLDEANKIGKINLAATGKDLMEEEKPGDVTIDLFAALDMESEATLERSQEILTNQKLGLLHGFLCIDDWSHAHMLLERLANLNPVAHPQICDGLFRAIERAISSSYRLVRPPYLWKLDGPSVPDDTPSVAEVDLKYSGPLAAFVEVDKEFFQMLSCVGPYLYRDALLLQKVCRVLRGFYSSALSLLAIPCTGELGRKDARLHLKEARLRTEEALGNCLLPSLQLLPANPAVGLEIWEVMSLLPYEARYRLYGEWEKEDERLPMLVVARQTAKLDTRRILKRLAKENLKQLGRMVAKIAHANPMTVLRTIVHQIEAYKDMITPVVDAFKYLTQLEYDVLEYVVIERLAQGGREKLKEDGLNLSDWLQSLASFWGHLCKKYPSMELRGLFQYLVNQLKKGEGIELVVLQELIQQMANVEYTENMTEEQLEAMAGGETLRFQATSFGATKNNKALLKSTNRLRDALLPKDEPKLAIPLLLLIAQHRSRVVINADAPYIKMVSEQFDRCHGTLLQYVEFLSSAVTPSTLYAQLIPSLDELLHKYHIEPEVCFLVYRPVMRLFKPFKGASVTWPMDTAKLSLQADGNDESSSIKLRSDLLLDLGSAQKPFLWSELLATVHSMLPSKSWNSLSPELYATFWGLSLQDLYVPRKRYETEIAKQHAALKALEESSDNSHAAITKRKKDKEKIQEVLDRLSSELQKQEQNVNAVHQRLVREKDSWLTSCPDSLKINMEFLQRCIFPRCVFSMLDAIYCARFVHTLHSLGTPFFNTVNHIDVLICKTLQPMISCCTEYEAGRFGRFLYETLKMAYYWKSQEVIYEKECGNMPGFAVLYRDPNSTRVTFTQFVRVHWKWSSRITKLLIQCLESSEYIEIRNALTVLTKISSVFPVTRKSGMNLEKRVGKIKGDEREDLKVLATGVAAALAARKSAWVTDEEFGMGLVDFKPAASPAKLSGSASSAAPNSIGTHPEAIAVARGVGTDPTDNVRNPGPPSTSLTEFSSARVDSSLQGTKSEATKLVAPSGSKDMVISLAQATAIAQAEASKPSVKHMEDVSGRLPSSLTSTIAGAKVDESGGKGMQKTNQPENEGRTSRRTSQTSLVTSEPARLVKSEASKEERESGNRVLENVRQRPATMTAPVVVSNGTPSNAVANKSTGGEKKGPPESAAKVRSGGEVTSEITIENNKTAEVKGAGDHEPERNDAHDTPISHLNRPPLKSPRIEDVGPGKLAEDISKEKPQKRSNLVDEAERTTKRRKGDGSERSGEAGEFRTTDRERVQQDQRAAERPRSVEHEKSLHEERTTFDKPSERTTERSRERVNERPDREHRGERAVERPERSREEYGNDRFRDRSMERFPRERSVDRVAERTSGFDRPADRSKDDRSRARYSDQTVEQPHPDDRFPMQNLPPPPPLPPNVVPQSLTANRREEEDARRTVRPATRTSPRREEKVEKRRSEEGSMASIDESKRRDEDLRDRKREDRDVLPGKAEKERDRDKEKSGGLLKEEDSSVANSKRRRLKRDHLSSEMPSNFGPSPQPPPPPLPAVVAQQYDRERDRKSSVTLRSVYEEPGYDKGPSGRVHGKDTSKVARRDHEQTYDRDWDDDKRPRGDIKRRHHRKLHG